MSFALLVLPVFPAEADGPAAIAAPGQVLVTTVHAVGAQIYECRSDAAGKLAWQFREPIATLFLDGKTVGRHYAGPNWEMLDGSAVVAKVVRTGAGSGARATSRCCGSTFRRAAAPASCRLSARSSASTPAAASPKVRASAPVRS